MKLTEKEWMDRECKRMIVGDQIDLQIAKIIKENTQTLQWCADRALELYPEEKRFYAVFTLCNEELFLIIDKLLETKRLS